MQEQTEGTLKSGGARRTENIQQSVVTVVSDLRLLPKRTHQSVKSRL